ncbi:hypothetical protein KIN20_016284 [Parelaphostrongylus tenuis]|uniref:Uncharacterized protein n=1 Tax=Parelaphostrongylus tenuis TaxID=148309 RepID=A0AAD5MG74_PARTN|nr:hypothetical protein KIN20_016284 [Parelaphostrongylus tenuis]
MKAMDTDKDMDELDNALFGRSGGSKSKPSLGNIDSLLGETKKPTAKKTTVSFLDAPGTSSTTASALNAPTKSALDDLFTDTTSEQKPATTSSSPASATQRPSRHVTGTTTLGSLLGPSRSAKESKPVAPAAAAVPVTTPPPQSTGSFSEDSLRTKRLENEVERLNREIEELKIRKKEDEQDIERLWKDKLSKKDFDHQQEVNDMRSNHEKHISKLEEEHSEELQRLRTTYERQLDTIQQSASQWK